MSRRQQQQQQRRGGGFLDELQTQQERDLQQYQPPKADEFYVNLDADDDTESDDHKEQLSFANQNQINHLKKLPKFIEGNQVNLDNAFKVKIPSDIKLSQCESFIKSSIYLQSLATLYGIRVDSTLRDSYKVKCGILRIHGANTYEENDLFDQPKDREKAQEKTSSIAKKKIINYGQSSLERNEKNILIKNYDTVQINPFFHLTSKKLDLQKLSSMLLYRPQYSNDISIIIDPEQLKQSERHQERHQNVKVEFSFAPPKPLNYDIYFGPEILELDAEPTFLTITQFKDQIDDECKRKNISISTRKFIPISKAKSEVKSSEIDIQQQQDWNQEMDHLQYQDSQQYNNGVEYQENNDFLQHILVSNTDSKVITDRDKNKSSVHQSQIDKQSQFDKQSQLDQISQTNNQKIDQPQPLMEIEQINQEFNAELYDQQLDQEWNFVNNYIDENVEPNFDENSYIHKRENQTEINNTYEPDYRNNIINNNNNNNNNIQQKNNIDHPESSGNESDILDLLDIDKIKIIPIMNKVIDHNTKNTNKIKDIIDMPQLNDVIYAPSIKQTRIQRKQPTQNSLSWNFDDSQSFNRINTLQPRKKIIQQLNFNLQQNHTEQQSHPPNLETFFEFSFREFFNLVQVQEQPIPDEQNSSFDNYEMFMNNNIYHITENMDEQELSSDNIQSDILNNNIIMPQQDQRYDSIHILQIQKQIQLQQSIKLQQQQKETSLKLNEQLMQSEQRQDNNQLYQQQQHQQQEQQQQQQQQQLQYYQQQQQQQQQTYQQQYQQQQQQQQQEQQYQEQQLEQLQQQQLQRQQQYQQELEQEHEQEQEQDQDQDQDQKEEKEQKEQKESELEQKSESQSQSKSKSKSKSESEQKQKQQQQQQQQIQQQQQNEQKNEQSEQHFKLEQQPQLSLQQQQQQQQQQQLQQQQQQQKPQQKQKYNNQQQNLKVKIEQGQKKNKKPYPTNFKVVLPKEKQNTQIPVKLLKQCVQKMIQNLLDQNISIQFSRIWLTIPSILPSVFKLITVSQLYIAILFLANEEKLILQRDEDQETKETDFTIIKAI